jgi:hypothetical protein
MEGDKMRLVDNLRNAEQKGARSIRRGVERVREEWADVERRIRQRMRIYPQKARAMAVAGQQGGSTMDMDGTSAGNERTADQQKPIVSVHGRDIES